MGRIHSSAEKAKRESEQWILQALRRYAEGLRFDEILTIIKEDQQIQTFPSEYKRKTFSKQTLSKRLTDLRRRKLVDYSEKFKRYSITPRGKEAVYGDNIQQVVSSAVLLPFLMTACLPNRTFEKETTAAFVQLKDESHMAYMERSRTRRGAYARLKSGVSLEKTFPLMPELTSLHSKLLFQRLVCFLFEPILVASRSTSGPGGLVPFVKLFADALERIRSGEFSDDDLEKVCEHLFPVPQRIVIADHMDSEEFLSWLKTDEGKSCLRALVQKASSTPTFS